MPAIVELGCVRGLVVGDVLRVFEHALVLEVCGDAGRAEGIAADAGLDARRLRAPLNHAVGVHVPHRVAGERPGLAGCRAEQGTFRVGRDVGGGDVFIEVLFEIVVAGHLVLHAAFLVQAHPAAPALHEVVAHLHLERGVDAREAVDHQRDERAIAQPHEHGFEAFRLPLARRVSHDGNAVEQLAGFLGGKHGRLAFFHDVLGAAHHVRRVYPDDLADYKPVEQHAQRGQVLLDRGCGEGLRLVILVLQVLEAGGDVERFDAGKLRDAVRLAPHREAPCRVHISLARVVVMELGGEEVAQALRGLGRRREERRRKHGGGRGGDEFGAHRSELQLMPSDFMCSSSALSLRSTSQSRQRSTTSNCRWRYFAVTRRR
jgi:hypothetical protein